MLDEPLFFSDPFPHLLCLDALPADQVAKLRATLGGDVGWAMQNESFYNHWSSDLPGQLVETLVSRADLEAVRRTFESLFATETAGRIQVLGQRMEPGHRIEVHNDAPRLGFETYRLVIYLDEMVGDNEGGILCLYSPGRKPQRERTVRPEPGLAFGFEMSRNSLHSVTPMMRGCRHSLVVNLWHVGNTPAIEKYVEAMVAEVEERRGDSAVSKLELLSCLLQSQVPEPDDIRDALLAARILTQWGMPADQCAPVLFSVVKPECWGAAARLVPDEVLHEARQLIEWTADFRDDAAGNGCGETGTGMSAALTALWSARLTYRVFEPARWRRIRELLRRLPPPGLEAARQAREMLFTEPGS